MIKLNNNQVLPLKYACIKEHEKFEIKQSSKDDISVQLADTILVLFPLEA